MLDLEVLGEGTVKMSGRLDAAESDRALEWLDTHTGDVTVECSGLEYISSAGIAVILQTFKRLRLAGGTLRLAGLTPRVRNVFVFAGLDKVLDLR